MVTLNASTTKRLDEIRGPVPRLSPSVRVLAAFAQNTACPLATLGFAAGVNFDRLLAGTAFQAPFGQSPFAIQRGLAFESMLRADKYALTLDLLRGPLGLPAGPVRVENLRAGHTDIAARERATAGLLKTILAGDPTAPRYLDGPVLSGTVGGLQAYFEADGLALRPADGVLRVAEIKSFPKVDERVDPEQLGAALDQVAVYVHLARSAVDALGGKGAEVVSDRALLINPRNVGLTPTLSEPCVAPRVTRVRRVLDAVPRAADVAANTLGDITFAVAGDTGAEEARRLGAMHAISDKVGTAYAPGCLSTCGNARFCRARAIGAGSPCATGTAAVRLLPEVLTLGRAADLTRGAPPAPAEAPAAELLERAGRLIDEATAAPVGAPLVVGGAA